MSNNSLSRKKTVLAVVLAVLAVPFFSCCVCAPMVAILIPSELAEADRMWMDGRKTEAVQIYSDKVESGIGVSNEIILERLVTYYFEQGDKERAKQYRRIAIENGTNLALSPDALHAAYEREKKAYEAAEKQQIAQEEREKQEAILKAQENKRRLAEKNKSDLERANDFWAEGKRAEAVRIYSVEITRRNSAEIPEAFERPIIYYHDLSDWDQAKKFVRVVGQTKLRLKFDSQQIQEFYDRESEAYRLEKEAFAKSEQAKMEQQAAVERENARTALKSRLDGFSAKLNDLEDKLVESVSVQRLPVSGEVYEAKITVNNLWHVRPYQVRLQDAQTLWEIWAQIASPANPDSARIELVDLNGNAVGGSRALAGSLIWVQKE